MKAKKNDSIRRRLASLGGTGIFNRWQRDLCDELGFSQNTNVTACYEELTGREKYLFDKVMELKYANSGLRILFDPDYDLASETSDEGRIANEVKKEIKKRDKVGRSTSKSNLDRKTLVPKPLKYAVFLAYVELFEDSSRLPGRTKVATLAKRKLSEAGVSAHQREVLTEHRVRQLVDSIKPLLSTTNTAEARQLLSAFFASSIEDMKNK